MDIEKLRDKYLDLISSSGADLIVIIEDLVEESFALGLAGRSILLTVSITLSDEMNELENKFKALETAFYALVFYFLGSANDDDKKELESILKRYEEDCRKRW